MFEPYVNAKVSPQKQVDELTRQLLRDKLEMLEPKSRDRFIEIWRHPFPEGDIVEQMSQKQLHDSIGLVDRTLQAAERRALNRGESL